MDMRLTNVAVLAAAALTAASGFVLKSTKKTTI
jgi:hypothetical protein